MDSLIRELVKENEELKILQAKTQLGWEDAIRENKRLREKLRRRQGK